MEADFFKQEKGVPGPGDRTLPPLPTMTPEVNNDPLNDFLGSIPQCLHWLYLAVPASFSIWVHEAMSKCSVLFQSRPNVVSGRDNYTLSFASKDWPTHIKRFGPEPGSKTSIDSDTEMD